MKPITLGIYLTVLSALASHPVSEAADQPSQETIQVVDLADLSGFALNGRAAIVNSPPVVVDGIPVLRIADVGCTNGSAFLLQPILLQDGTSETSFSTHFVFQLAGDPGGGQGGDGFTFAFVDQPTRLGSGGGGLGYGGIGSSIAVEFDTYLNGEHGDPDASHVGVDRNGSMVSLARVSVPGPLDNAGIWHAWIDYDANDHTLDIRVTQSSSRPSVPTLSLYVNLFATLNQTSAFIGFTAGTCFATNTHDIRYWEYQSYVLEPPSCLGDHALQVGGAGWMEAADSASLDVSGDLTIEYWAKIDPAAQILAVSKWHDGSLSQRSYFLTARDQEGGRAPRITWSSNGSNFFNMFGPGPISVGEWHHVAGVREGAQSRVYVDGVLVASGTPGNTSPIFNNSEPLRIGQAYLYNTLLYSIGEVEDVRVWNTVRTQEQIEANRYLLHTPTSGLVARWTFDEDAGGAIDGSGNGNTGALFGDARRVCSTAPLDFDGDGDGFTRHGGDCDDTDGSIHPGATELCDGRDDDCDGSSDEGFDLDSDGWTACSGDCEDSNPNTHPAAREICDNRDNDCDGTTDEATNLDLDHDGFTTCQNDCDDNNASKKPLPGQGCDSANHGMDSGSPVTNDPVNVATGNLTQEEIDLRIAGRGMDLVFSRAYNSKDAVDGPLGFGWTHGFRASLSLNTDGTRTARMEDGHTEIYSPDGAGGFTPPYGLQNTLVANGDGSHTLTRKSDRLRYDFDGTGRLTRIRDKNANQIVCNYTGSLLTSLTDTVGRQLSLGYDGSNRVTLLTDPIGRTVIYGYDGAGNLASVKDVRGFTTGLSYDSNHQLLTITDARGNPSVTNVYDSASRVVSSQQDALGNGTQYVYDWVLNKTEVTDPLTHKTVFYYDNLGKTLRVVDPLAHELSYAYDANGQRTSMTDKNGKVTLFTYDYKGNVLTRTDPDSAVTEFTYDASDHVTKRRDPLGFEEIFSYDAFGNQASWIDRTGKTETRTYTAAGQLQTLTDRRGKTTTFGYDTQGNRTSVTDPLGKVSSHTYDGLGRRLTTTDPNQHQTTVFYDNADHVIQVRDALLHSTFFGFDPNGNPTTRTDATGGIVTRQYDVKNRLTKVTDPLLHETSYTYDANDRKLTEIDPRGNTTTFGYDAGGNLATVTDPLLHVTMHSYDAVGRRVTTTDPEMGVTHFAYDAMGRLLSTTDQMGHTTSRTYDLRGDEKATTDPLLHTTTYERDGEQRLTTIVDALGGRSEFNYDEEGHRRTLENANGHTTVYAYDSVGRLLSVSDPLLNTTSYGYDDGGRRTSRTDASSRTTNYGYDAADRLTTITYPNLTTATIGYDDAGRRTSLVDGTGTTAFVYDLAGRATSVTDGNGRTIGYGYDNAGNRTSTTLPGPLTVSYTYDGLNRLKTLTDWLGGNATYTYSPAGHLTEVTLPNGTADTMAYDLAGRLTRQTTSGTIAGTIADYVIALDNAGNRTAIDRIQPLTGALSDLGETYLYDIGERVLSRGDASYGHDPQGNMTSRLDITGTTTFTYNFDNLMTGVVRPGASDSYSCDAEGNRTLATRAGGQTQYLLDRIAPLVTGVVEHNSAGVANRRHILGHRILWTNTNTSTRIVYHTDPLGSVVAVTDANQSVIASFDYDEFGALIASTGTVARQAHFVGSLGVTEEPSALNFMRARHYDPVLGRLLGKDKWESLSPRSDSHNPYQYALNSPLQVSDPSGEWVYRLGVNASTMFGFGGFAGGGGLVLGTDATGHVRFGGYVTGGPRIGFGGDVSFGVRGALSPEGTVASGTTDAFSLGATTGPFSYSSSVDQNGKPTIEFGANLGSGLGAYAAFQRSSTWLFGGDQIPNPVGLEQNTTWHPELFTEARGVCVKCSP